jgi:heavy metal sensor kinase
MRLFMRPLALRLRLTLWYAGAMIIVLALYAATVFVVVSRSDLRDLDAQLREHLEWPSTMLYRAPPDGSIEPYYPDPGCEVCPWLQVWSPGGDLLYETPKAYQNPVPGADQRALEASGRFVTVEDMAPPHRVLSAASQIGGEPVVIQVAENLFDMREAHRELFLILVLGLPLSVAVAGVGGYSLARRALAPVHRMADQAQAITAERLTERLRVDNPEDELGRLATVFNETLTRLESSFDQIRSFTAHASHELRTPLTAIRSVGEVGLRQQRSAEGYREVIGSMLEEVDRLAGLVDRLLILSRLERGAIDLASDRVDLGELLAEVANQLEVLAEEKSQRVDVVRTSGLIWQGDRTVLRQALLNLLDNAIKYTPADGRIGMRVSREGRGFLLEVSDTGPGIPPGLEARVFDRFYRGDEALSSEGSGLGLSIALWAVEVCGGRLTLDRSRETGSTFHITLPDNVIPTPGSVRSAQLA